MSLFLLTCRFILTPNLNVQMQASFCNYISDNHCDLHTFSTLAELNTTLSISHINALLMEPLALWNAHSVRVDNNLQFIDCKIFEVLAEKQFTNKYRKFETIIDDAFAGCGLNTKDLLRRIPMKGQSKPTVCIAVSNCFLIDVFFHLKLPLL